jgi:hypothetical protein
VNGARLRDPRENLGGEVDGRDRLIPQCGLPGRDPLLQLCIPRRATEFPAECDDRGRRNYDNQKLEALYVLPPWEIFPAQ